MRTTSTDHDRTSRRRAALLNMLVAMTILSPTVAGADDAKPTYRSPSGPTLAVEDTLADMAEPLPEVLVTAPRQTLDEILRHVAEGEAYRDSMIQDQAYTVFFRRNRFRTSV